MKTAKKTYMEIINIVGEAGSWYLNNETDAKEIETSGIY
jgi:hypothetical protein